MRAASLQCWRYFAVSSFSFFFFFFFLAKLMCAKSVRWLISWTRELWTWCSVFTVAASLSSKNFNEFTKTQCFMFVQPPSLTLTRCFINEREICWFNWASCFALFLGGFTSPAFLTAVFLLIRQFLPWQVDEHASLLLKHSQLHEYFPGRI